MTSPHLLRIGAAACVLVVVVEIAAAVLEPARIGGAEEAIRTIAQLDTWTVRWLVHVTASILLVIALSVVTCTFSGGAAGEWTRAGRPLLAVGGALGVAEVMAGAGTKDLADGWAAAPSGERLPYLTAFEGAWNLTVDLDFGAILVFAVFLLTLAAAILAGDTYARWLGWTTAAAGLLVGVGIVLELASPVGTALEIVGNLAFFVVLICLGVSMWRKAAASGTTVTVTGTLARPGS